MIWQTKKLGKIVSIVTGKLDANAAVSDGKFPFYTCSESESLINETAFDGESILLSGNGIFLVKYHEAGKFNAYQRVYVIKALNSDIFLRYIYYFLEEKVPKLVSQGAVIKYLRLPQLTNLEISLPPLSEQKKIVKILDEKMKKIAEAKKMREEVLINTEKVLSQTLQEIFEEGKKKRWEEKTIGDIAIQIKSGFACGKQNEVSDGIVHLRTHNISLDGQLNLDKIVKIPKSFVNTNVFTLKKDDLIFNNTNSVELVGKTILIQEDLPYAFSNHLTRTRFDKKQIIPSWVLYVFQKYWSDKVFERMCTRWIGQAGINQTILSKMKILVPTLAEQQKIVKRLDALSAKIRHAVLLQKLQLEDFRRLEKSYLKEAFNGELV